MRKISALAAVVVVLVATHGASSLAAQGGVANETPVSTTTAGNTPTTTAMTTAPPTTGTERTATGTTPTPSTDGTDARFTVERVTLSDTWIPIDEAVSVTLQVRNVGDRNGTYRANLSIDNESVDSGSVTLGAGANGTLVFDHRFEALGAYQVSVNGLSLGNVSVGRQSIGRGPTTRPSGGPASGAAVEVTPPSGQGPIEILDATLPDTAVASGSSGLLQVTLRNPTDGTASRRLIVSVDGRPVANRTVTLGGGEQAVIRIGFEARNGTVAVDGIEAGRIRTGTPADDTRRLVGPRVMPAGAAVGLVGVLVGVAVLLARQAV
jgi:hypothetical protein